MRTAVGFIVLLVAVASSASALGSREIATTEFPAQLGGAVLCLDGKLVIGIGIDGKIYLM